MTPAEIQHRLDLFNQTNDWSVFNDVPEDQHVSVMYPHTINADKILKNYMKNSLIFIAVPSKGVAANGALNDQFIKDVASLHEFYPDKTFLVPMIQDYALLKHLKVQATWEVWGHHCQRLIAVCDEVWVLKYEGWTSSIGVGAEVDCALQYNKSVKFLETHRLSPEDNV